MARIRNPLIGHYTIRSRNVAVLLIFALQIFAEKTSSSLKIRIHASNDTTLTDIPDVDVKGRNTSNHNDSFPIGHNDHGK